MKSKKSKSDRDSLKRAVRRTRPAGYRYAPAYRWNPESIPTSIRFRACTMGVLEELKKHPEDLYSVFLPYSGKLTYREILELTLEQHLHWLFNKNVIQPPGGKVREKYFLERYDQLKNYEDLCDFILELYRREPKSAEEWKKKQKRKQKK